MPAKRSLGLCWPALLMLLGVAAGAESPVERSTPLVLPLSLRSSVKLAPRTAASLRDEVLRIFQPAGLTIDWDVSAGTAWIAVSIERKPLSPVITGCSRGKHDHRLAVAQLGPRRITLWTEQVARAVGGDWDARNPPHLDEETEGRALGRVLAHELGHVLLGLDGHRRRGLLRKSFKHRELRQRHTTRFQLASEDVEHLREMFFRIASSRESSVKTHP